MLKRNLMRDLILSIILIGLSYFVSVWDYLLFHTFTELISITVAFALFAIAWNSREFSTNNYLLFLGIAYLFIGSIDFIHTLSYKGMNILDGYDANLPTQLWIIARYMESISLVIASFFINKKINAKKIMLFFVTITILLLLFVFLNLFPVCFIESSGLTLFKKISEYIISIILIIALWRYHKLKVHFQNRIRWMIYLSVMFTIFAEISFTFYVSVYGLSNYIGHVFKVVSFFLIYKALIYSSLKRPYSILFKDLQKSESRYRKAQEIGHVGNWEYNIETSDFWGSYEAKLIYGFDINSHNFTIEEVESCIPDRKNVHQALIDLIEKEKPYDLEFEIITKDKRESKYIHSIAELEKPETGKPVKVTGVVTDITQRKKAEKELRQTYQQLKELNKDLEKKVKRSVQELRDKDYLLIKQSRQAAMGEMIGNIAHQWRQPLSAVSAIVQDIEDAWEYNELDAAYLNKSVTAAMDQLQFMSRTIDDFRNFFKPNKIKSEFKAKAIVEKTATFISKSFTNNKIELETNLEEVTILGFENEYSQVILNILNNAKDAILKNNENGGKVTIELKEEAGKSVLIICDTGGGIPPKDLDKIFDPYYTTKEQGKGTGIGLYMSKMIIENNMEGKIEAYNLEAGVCFKIMV